MLFLQAEVLSKERIAMDGFGLSDEQSANNKNKRKNKESKEIATAAGLISIKENKHICIFYDQNHDSTSCGKAKKMPYEKRLQIVKEKNPYYHCLNTILSFIATKKMCLV